MVALANCDFQIGEKFTDLAQAPGVLLWHTLLCYSFTAIPRELKEKAGVFRLHLPHGRDE
jgi:hypothetical protein